MGGDTFDQTIILSQTDYQKWISRLESSPLRESIDYMLPFRFQNKNTYSDIDLIVSNTDLVKSEISKIFDISQTKTIPLFDGRFDQYSEHLLTQDGLQIDLLKSWCSESMEFTRAYYSYNYANVFLKRMVALASQTDFKLSYLGLMCSNNKYIVPSDIKCIRIEANTRLIIDPVFLFDLIDLDYNVYKSGFLDEFELLEFLKTSIYFNKIVFRRNSKFNHDYKRLPGFKSIVDKKLI